MVDWILAKTQIPCMSLKAKENAEKGFDLRRIRRKVDKENQNVSVK